MPFKPDPTDHTKVIYKTSEYWIPKPWQGLTQEDRDNITKDIIGFNNCCGWEDAYAKAIESRLKEKNGATSN